MNAKTMTWQITGFLPSELHEWHNSLEHIILFKTHEIYRQIGKKCFWNLKNWCLSMQSSLSYTNQWSFIWEETICQVFLPHYRFETNWDMWKPVAPERTLQKMIPDFFFYCCKVSQHRIYKMPWNTPIIALNHFT